MSFSLLILFVFYSGIFCNDVQPTIKISNGFVRGFHEETYNGNVYSAFEGLPYGEPPIADLRFEAPQEVTNWTGIFEANKKYACRYFVSNPPELELEGLQVTEDCLRLNVYVPKEHPSTQDNFDVIVHIHSGSFMVGHPHTLYGPKHLMDKNVIYISLSYRLGPIGYLSTEDDVIPGNNGMKDQTLALKWIQKNIKYFGGNPQSVTITGMSAGGASVHLHYMSPLSQGLFQRGYSASGTALDPWVLQVGALEKAKRLASLVGCNPVTSRDILNCVKEASYDSIVDAVKTFRVNDMPFSLFGPIIEHQHEGAFLDKHPYDLLIEGHMQDLPWLVAINAHEGIFPAAFYYSDLEAIENDWFNFAPHLLEYNYTAPADEKEVISTKVKENYFGNDSITYQKLIKLCSDRHFFRGPENSIKLQNANSKSPIYMLMFAYIGEYSHGQLFGVPDTERGVAHGDETIYYLSSTIFGRFNEDDEKVKNILLDIVVSFANESIPKVDGFDWRPTTTENVDYFYFDGFTDFEMRQEEDIGSVKFWKSLGLNEKP